MPRGNLRPQTADMSAQHVNADNFVRAETDRMFAAVLADAGGVNRLNHNRTPTPLDHQPVIRMNRDTLYSAAVVDISEGATLTLPDTQGRYLSAMVVNRDHYINEVLHEPGDHELTTDRHDTDVVLVAIRTLVDPADPDDVAAVNALQDRIRLTAAASRPFTTPDYDAASLDRTRAALLELAKGYPGFDRAFGSRLEVDPVRHLIGTAAGWGGLPSGEATYVNVDPGLPVGEYQLTVRDVPVDGFWSISLYNSDGYFDDDGSAVSLNNLTAQRDPDGSVTVHFGGCGDGRPNCLGIKEGWNYLVRLYRPRSEVLDGTWAFPSVTPVP
ncbi:hypothetical protein GCM10009721_05150 [Terrabacter tumescens]|uniref:Carboxylesterase n=2 Tax=Terrabacter tumescens TaxID=60443 RepID=A0ABQ2HJL2_9MICO|nr:hypothetical protein GCM10009721_05150 [Terrabacter tumescens]